MADKEISLNLHIGADTNQAKKSIQELQATLQSLGKNTEVIHFDDAQYRDAVKAAQELEMHLSKAVNVDTGKLDLTRLNSSLKQSNQTLQQYAARLTSFGTEGVNAFLKLSNAIAAAETPTIRVNSKLKAMLDNIKKTAGWQISSTLIHGVMSSVNQAVRYAQDLNESLTNIRIVTQQNTDQMAKFAVEANKAAKALSTTTTKYTDAALIYYQQGIENIFSWTK